MKKYYLLTNLILIFFCSNIQGQNSNSLTNFEKKSLTKGEWIVKSSWTDNTLIFENKNDKDIKQEPFTTYNTIIFNKNNNAIKVNTYGEFGCGTAASQNLKFYNTKWAFKNNQLYIIGKYSDYTGEHIIEELYYIEINKETLKLKKIKEN